MRSPGSSKSKRAQASNSIQRAPSRCSVCAGRPLRSQCIHTKSGKKHLQQLSTSPVPAVLPVTENPSSGDNRPTDQLPDVHQASGSDPVPQSLGLPNPGLADVSMLDNPQASLHLLLQLYRNQLTNHQSASESCPASTPLSSTPLPSTPPLTTTSHSSQVPPVQDLPVSSIFGLERTPAPQVDEDDDPFASPACSPNTSGQHKRVRVSSTNAVYSFVAGAMRGNKALTIAQTAPLRPTCETISQATRRFNREIPQILSRCERVSEETGCWLILAAQHANSTSAATHYTSPRLQREARKETVDILNSFQTLTSCLLASKREEALHLAQKLAAVEKAKEQALEAKNAELAERDELISQYQEQLRALGA